MSFLPRSLQQFHAERAETARRNTSHNRPTASSTPARTSTPGPAEKRSHEAAFAGASNANASASAAPMVATGILDTVSQAISYIKNKSPQDLTFDAIISWLSLPHDLQAKKHLFHRALSNHPRITWTQSAESEKALREGKAPGDTAKSRDLFRYRPLVPVRDKEQLRNYLAGLVNGTGNNGEGPSAKGVGIKELKDGWPDCIPAIDELETQGYVLVLRNKKDNAPRHVWFDDPKYHLLIPSTSSDSTPAVRQASPDFAERWLKLKLPAGENDVRNELERAGITPTSAVKAVVNAGMQGKKKERKRVERKNGKKTNTHMAGILKDYSKMRK
jgi:transcription initiation factor TFIIE subunit beta